MIPTTYLSLHDILGLKAVALNSLDTPLILTVESPHGQMQISLYFTDVDVDKIERMADAINAVMREPAPPPKALPIEEIAAYSAADICYGVVHVRQDGVDSYWANLKRDLDRDPIGAAP